MTGNNKVPYDYLIEFSNSTGMVYLNERDPNTDFWEEVQNYEVDTSPEDFAYGVYEALKGAGYQVDFENLDLFDEESEEDDENSDW